MTIYFISLSLRPHVPGWLRSVRRLEQAPFKIRNQIKNRRTLKTHGGALRLTSPGLTGLSSRQTICRTSQTRIL